MTDEDRLDRLIKLRITLENILGEEVEVIEDYIYTEQQERGWLDSERELGQNFTKRIATPFPTKRRRRVT